jgi:uncharacterized OB-fold protein
VTELPSAPHSIDEFVRAYESERRLRGFRCPACGATTTTWGLACSTCGAGPLLDADLPTEGTIVAGTIVQVAPDDFVNEAPYAYVIVELTGGARLSGWLPGVRSEGEIAPGTPVRFRPGYKAGVQFERREPSSSAEGH